MPNSPVHVPASHACLTCRLPLSRGSRLRFLCNVELDPPREDPGTPRGFADFQILYYCFLYRHIFSDWRPGHQIISGSHG